MIPAPLVGLVLKTSPKEWVEFIRLLLDLYPDAYRLWRAWRKKHGRRMTKADRKKLAAELRQAVAYAKATKDTSRLEALFAPRAPEDGQ
jgi:hypothetical protein